MNQYNSCVNVQLDPKGEVEFSINLVHGVSPITIND